MQYIYKYQSPIGGITIASDGSSLTGLWFDGQKYFAASLSPEHEEKVLPVFEQTIEWLDCYFSGKNPGFMPEIHLESTPFRLSVWEILKKIPMSKNKNVDTLANIILRGFNEELREHLTKWQARFRKWYEENKNESGDPQEIQKKYPQYEELISDLKKVNYKMIALTEELNKIRKGE